MYDQCNVTVSEGFLPQYSVYYKRRAVETVRIGKNNLKTFKQYIRGADSDAYRFYVVLFQICQVVFTGALRGAGDVVYTMISSTISVTFVRTAVSYICCYIVGWGIYGIWMGIVADQFCRLMLSGIRFRSGKWMKIKI